MDISTLACDVTYPADINHEKKYRVGIVIMVYNRSRFVRRCFESLEKTRLRDAVILIVDDASTELEAVRLVKEFSMPGVPVIKIFMKEHGDFKIHDNLRFCFDLLLANYHQLEYLATLDSDTIQKPEWLEKLYELYDVGKKRYGDVIVSGFNTSTHYTFVRKDSYCIKVRLGGVSLFFDKTMYYKLVRESLKFPHWDDRLSNGMMGLGYPFLVTTPSVIQHIGSHGLFSSAAVGHNISEDYSLASRINFCFVFLVKTLYSCCVEIRARLK